MNDQPWFKVWAAKTLLSDSLDSLTDHEERIWWRLLCVASLEEPRWTFGASASVARKCKTTLPKLRLAIDRFMARDMVDAEEEIDCYRITHGEEFNTKPSDARSEVATRVRRHRSIKEGGNAPVTPLPSENVTPRNALHPNDCNAPRDAREEERRGEEEKEERESRAEEEPAAAAGPEIAPDIRCFREWERATGFTLTPMLGEQISDAVESFPVDWVIDAIRETGDNRAKSWKYTQAILDRWKRDGRDAGPRELTEEEAADERKRRYVPPHWEGVIQYGQRVSS